MNPVLRNILAVLAGIVVGSVVNMAIIMFGGSLVPLPEGVDPTSMESLKESMHLFKPINFLMPFLAHALGTLVGAFITVKFAANRHYLLAMIIGVFFLAGGIMSIMSLPAPMWFNAVDLLLAYLPMAWLGWKLGR